MTSLAELLEKAEEIGAALVENGKSRFSQELQPKLRNLVIRGTQIEMRHASGVEVGKARVAIESQLSDIGVQERLWVVELQRDLLQQVIVAVLDLAT